jgi:hypothetical protein
MAFCTQCGNKAGMLRDLCHDCEVRLTNEREAAAEAKRLEDAAAWQAEVESSHAAWLAATQSKLSAGNSGWVYKYVYLEVNSVVTDEVIGTWDLAPLQAAGLAGWQVLGVIPRTVGIGLQNTSYGASSGTTWGAGVGGNVAGAYVLLGRELKSLSGEVGEEASKLALSLISEGYEI